jgi:hypothetical protein
MHTDSLSMTVMYKQHGNNLKNGDDREEETLHMRNDDKHFTMAFRSSIILFYKPLLQITPKAEDRHRNFSRSSEDHLLLTSSTRHRDKDLFHNRSDLPLFREEWAHRTLDMREKFDRKSQRNPHLVDVRISSTL